MKKVYSRSRWQIKVSYFNGGRPFKIRRALQKVIRQKWLSCVRKSQLFWDINKLNIYPKLFLLHSRYLELTTVRFNAIGIKPDSSNLTNQR
jgi:hypothetical protein